MGIFDDLVPVETPPTAADGGRQPLRITIRPGDNMTPGPPMGHFADLIPGAAVSDQGPPLQVGKGTAGLEGYLDMMGAGWRDEVKGASDASGLPEWLGGFRAPIGVAKMLGITGQEAATAARKSYEEGRDKIRALREAALEQQPGAFRTGQAAGLVGSVALLPGVTAVKGAGAAAKIGNAALTGATYGAIGGAGEGEGAADTVGRAVTGLGLGATLGAAVPAVVAPTAKALYSNTVGRFFQGATEAGRTKVAGQLIEKAAKTDGATGAAIADEVAAHNAAGNPIMPIDVGGEAIKRLADGASVRSPEAGAAFKRGFEGRAADDLGRAVEAISGPGGVRDATLTREALEAAARRQNRPAYAHAYAAGDRPIISEELQRLMGHPDVEDAMRSAVRNGKGYAINEGHGGFNSRIEVTPDGRVNFGKGPSGVPTYPNIQYWDYVQRELSNAEGKAIRSGGGTEATRIGGAKRALNAELDDIVPEFGDARKGAAAFFGAENASEAGEKFITSTLKNSEARQAFARFSPAEQQMFRESAASKLVKTLNEAGNTTKLANQILNKPAARERMEIGLGPDGALRMETWARLKGMMNAGERAITGNSRTAQRLTDASLILGGGGLDGMYEGSPGMPSVALVAAILSKNFRRGINDKVAAKLGELLSSQDPAALRQALDMFARNPTLMDGLRRASSLVDRTVKNAGTAPARAIGGPNLLPKGSANADQDQ